MTSKQILLVGVGTMFAFSLPLFASAAVFYAGDQVNLPAGEVVRDDVYASGGSVTVSSEVTGDLYAAGGTILVSGAVGGDVVVGGGNVTVTGNVADDLRAGGGNVVVQGTVASDILIAGGQVHLAGGRVGGDVAIGGGSVRIDSPVMGDVFVGGGEVYLNSAIAGAVKIEAERLTLGPNARIAGDLTYRATSEATIEDGAEVAGAINFEPREERGGNVLGVLIAIFSLVALVFLLMLGLGALLFALFFKRYAHEVVANAYANVLLELGRGLLVLIVTPVISVLLMVSIVGIPLGVLGLTLYIALLISSWLMAPVIMGSFVHRWFYKSELVVSWKTVLLGVAVFFLVGFVPIVGGLTQLGFMLLALGSIARLKWHIAKSWR